MTSNLPNKTDRKLPEALEEDIATHEFVTMFLAGQMFGIPVLQVQDVLGPQKITRVPLASAEIAGSLNLRGRIVTAIDVRTRLGLESHQDVQKSMSIAVDHEGEFYSLIVDQVGEVLSVPATSYEKTPPTLDARWKEIADGVYRLDGNLLIVLDVKRLLNLESRNVA